MAVGASDLASRDSVNEARSDERVAMTALEVRLTQGLALLVGVALVIVGLVLWLRKEGPAVQTVTTVTSTIVRDARAHGQPTPASQMTTVRERTTTVTDGTGSEHGSGSSQNLAPRSETVTVAFVGAGVLLMLVGLMYPRLRGASGAGASITVDAISVVRRTARRQLAADSRLPSDAEDRATALFQARLQAEPELAAAVSSATKLGGEVALTPEFAAAIDQTLAALVRRPEVRTSAERYVGDFVSTPGTGLDAPLVGRILFYLDSEHFDVVRAGTDVAWGSETSRRNTARAILVHASGNRAPPTEIVERFVVDPGSAFQAGKPWSIPLRTMLDWIDANWPEGS